MCEATRTLWVGNLLPKVDEELLFELFQQAGPVDKVTVAREKNGCSKGYAFINYKHEVSVPYAIALMKGISLFEQKILPQEKTTIYSPYQNHLKRASLQDHRRPLHQDHRFPHPNMTAGANEFQAFNIPVVGSQEYYSRNCKTQTTMTPPMSPDMVCQSYQNHKRRRTYHGFQHDGNGPYSYGGPYSFSTPSSPNFPHFDNGASYSFPTPGSPNLGPFNNSEDRQQSKPKKDFVDHPTRDTICCMSENSCQDRPYLTIFNWCKKK